MRSTCRHARQTGRRRSARESVGFWSEGCPMPILYGIQGMNRPLRVEDRGPAPGGRSRYAARPPAQGCRTAEVTLNSIAANTNRGCRCPGPRARKVFAGRGHLRRASCVRTPKRLARPDEDSLRIYEVSRPVELSRSVSPRRPPSKVEPRREDTPTVAARPWASEDCEYGADSSGSCWRVCAAMRGVACDAVS